VKLGQPTTGENPDLIAAISDCAALSMSYLMLPGEDHETGDSRVRRLVQHEGYTSRHVLRAMPSYLHELLLLLFRNRSQAAADLLRRLDVQMPDFDDVRVESADLNHVKPAEYRADLVLFLMRGTQKQLGIIIEVQLQDKEEKRYSWPAYVANLRARHRCPVCLLVITVDEATARWAAEPIKLGPDNWFTPRVVGPSNTLAVTDLSLAEQNVELAVLSAIEHGKNTDSELAARVASTAIVASAGIDAERSRLYLDLILISLSEKARRALQSMNSLGFEYQSDFARKYVAQGRAEGKAEGKAEGRAEGRAEILLKQLTSRFGPPEDDLQARLYRATDSQLDTVAEELLTAPTLAIAVKAIT
jgi:hypothetical protein